MLSRSKKTPNALITVRKVQMNLGLIKIKYNSQGKSSLKLIRQINAKEKKRKGKKKEKTLKLLHVLMVKFT